MAAAFPETRLRLDTPHSDPTMDWYLQGAATTDQEGLLLEPAAEALRQMEESGLEPWPEAVRENAILLAKAGLWPGEDFLVIPYIGRPKTTSQNAANAQRHGARGVELSAIAKSFAGIVRSESGQDTVVILTGPSDLSFKTSGISMGQVGELEPVDDEQLAQLGFEHGTVSPLGALTEGPGTGIRYLFDRDFIDKDTRDPDKKVYISGGDPAWSIALDIRKLMTAATQCAPFQVVTDICEREAAADRVFARHDITLISGDSAQVGRRYYEALEGFVRAKLREAGAYFGDDSMPNLDLLSRGAMGGTGAVAIHRGEVIDYIGSVLGQIPESRRERLIAFTSNAANLGSIAGPVSEAVRDRSDLRVVTTQDALGEYIKTATPARVIILGLPDVTEQYPDTIGETAIVKGKGKIAEWMQTARSGNEAEILEASIELKKLIEKTAKLEMANQQQLDGRQKGEFMQNPDIRVEGTVLVAGTELWEILDAAGWQEGLPGLEEIKLIDPVSLLMQHLAKISLEGQV